MSSTPPGWYPNNEGKLQWWDGKQWGPLAPTMTEQLNQEYSVDRQKARPVKQDALAKSITTDPVVQTKKMSGWGKFLIGVVVVAVLWGFVVAIQAGTDAALSNAASRSEGSNELPLKEDDTETVIEEKKPEPAPAPPPRKTEAELFDESAKAAGFKVFRSGEIYLDVAEGGTCGYYPCIDYVILSRSACHSGFYVRANITSGGVPIGWTNEITASVQANNPIIVRLQDHIGGDQVQITEISCMG